jgi:uroporphyrin-III C-methyltransferase
MMFGRADEEIQALKDHHIAVEVVPGITAALAGAASIAQSLTLRGVSRSVAFVTLAQGQEHSDTATSLAERSPLAQPSADTLVYYMGRKDAVSIAKQLIEGGIHHGTPQNSETPVHILEAVSTQNERHWSSTLGQLANGEAENWYNTASPALIMIGEALRQKAELPTRELQCSGSEFNNGLKDSLILTNGRRSS